MHKMAVACVDAELTDLPRDSEGAVAVGTLRAKIPVIEELSAAQTTHTGAAQSGTAQRSAARKDIKEYLTTLARTADTIARRKTGFDDQFPMPYGKNDEQLLAAARSVHAAATENTDDFIRLGLTREYLDSAQSAIAAFAAALGETNQALGSRGATVAGIDREFDESEDAFETLNAFVRNFYRDRPEKLAAWKIATHVERPPQKKKTDAPNA
jgi:hypothetical protein